MTKESEILFRAIESIVEKKLAKVGYDKEGLIMSKTTDGYNVIVSGCEYEIKNGTTWEFKQGDKCLVHYINGDSNKKIIISKL